MYISICMYILSDMLCVFIYTNIKYYSLCKYKNVMVYNIKLYFIKNKMITEIITFYVYIKHVI